MEFFTAGRMRDCEVWLLRSVNAILDQLRPYVQVPPAHKRTPADYIRLLGLATGATVLTFLIIWLLLDAIWELVVPFYAIFSAFYFGTLCSRPKIPWIPEFYTLVIVGDLLVALIGTSFDSFNPALLLFLLYLGAVAYLLPKEREHFKLIAFLGASLLLTRLLAVRGFSLFPRRLRPLPAYLASYLGLRLGLNCAATAERNRTSFESFLPANMKKVLSGSGPPPTSYRHSADAIAGLQLPPSRSRRVSLPAASFHGLDTRTQTNLTEAHGLVGEMLANEELPPRVVSNLRVISSLISQQLDTRGALTDLNCIKRVAEDPLTGEVVPVQRSVSVWRSSPVTWSTVTSATGLPTVEPEPSRSRSSSFWKKKQENENSPTNKLDETSDTRLQFSDGITLELAKLNLDPLLAKVGRYGFPIFDLSSRSPKTLLTELAYKIFRDADLLRIFKIPYRQFFSFFHSLELGYWEIPYHNRIHAADVLHSTYYLTTSRVPIMESNNASEVNENSSSEQTLSHVLSSLELLALYVAAAMHDYDHPGRTNAFLVAKQDPKAILYNDRAVLENHHAASAWRLLMKPDNFFLEALDEVELKRFRYMVIEAILATDLKRHFDIMDEFNGKFTNEGGIDWDSESDRLLAGQMCIKLADINAPTKPRDLHIQWTERLVEEFYTQGDEEKKLKMPVSMYMDRTAPNVPKLQDSFIAHIVSPLVDSMAGAGLLPVEEGEEEPELQKNIRLNHQYWLDQIDTTVTTNAPTMEPVEEED